MVYGTAPGPPPGAGLRFNPDKLLLDPTPRFAGAFRGPRRTSTTRDARQDNARYVFKSVVTYDANSTTAALRLRLAGCARPYAAGELGPLRSPVKGFTR